MRDQVINEIFCARVGGHLEPREDLLEHGKREVQEEIGLSIEYEGSKSMVYFDSIG